MAKQNVAFVKPACGHCGALSRPMGNSGARWRVCENGHRLYKRS